MGEAPPPETEHPSVLVRGAPVVDPLDKAVAKAKAEAALFGDAPAVKVGRYTLIERAGAGGMGVVWSAWDPELNRGVALKLASSGDTAARAQARDEGRALAKLSHPNVVPIFDVLDAPEGVFLVMELVAGQTLRKLGEEASARELVHAYRQAGEGLAAAHRAGLVHRDFKPDNAIVGADGRVRVLDFGLAHEDGATPGLGGTPRYMAPEQKQERALTAAVDQYALALSLREALAAKGGVPRWLEPVLARATADAAGDRYPAMDDLVRALGLDPRTRWRRRALAGGGVLALGAVAIAFAVGRARQEEEPCAGGAEIIAASWGGSSRGAAEAHLASLGSRYARDAAPRIAPALDAYARGWIDLHRNSCRAHQRGELSPALFDARSACLATRRAALATTGELASHVNDAGLPDLVVAVAGLPELRACEDDAALLSPVTPPTAMQAAEAGEIAELVARVDVERDAAQMEAATRDADAAVVRAKALGYPPLVPRALLARGRIDLALRHGDQGAAAFKEATTLAIGNGNDPLAVEAYARAVYALGTGDEKLGSAATEGLALVEALASRIAERQPFPRALLHNNLGSLALARGDRGAARHAFEAARRESIALRGSAAIELTAALRNLLLVTDDAASLEKIGSDLVSTRSRLLGATHPRTILARIAAAEILEDPDRARAQLAAACDDLHALHHGFSFQISICSLDVGWMAWFAEDARTARQMFERVLAMPDADDNTRTVAKGYLLLLDNDPAGCVAAVTSVEEVPEGAAPWRTLAGVDAAIAAASAESRAGRPAAAQAHIATSERLLARITSGFAPPIIHRRQHAISSLRAAR